MRFRNTAIKLKTLREKKSISQLTIAKKLGYKDARAISNFERGHATLPTAKMNKYRKLVKLSVKEMLSHMAADFIHHTSKDVK